MIKAIIFSLLKMGGQTAAAKCLRGTEKVKGKEKNSK